MGDVKRLGDTLLKLDAEHQEAKAPDAAALLVARKNDPSGEPRQEKPAPRVGGTSGFWLSDGKRVSGSPSASALQH